MILDREHSGISLQTHRKKVIFEQLTAIYMGLAVITTLYMVAFSPKKLFLQ
jgi:hypothetical protein